MLDLGSRVAGGARGSVAGRAGHDLCFFEFQLIFFLCKQYFKPAFALRAQSAHLES